MAKKPKRKLKKSILFKSFSFLLIILSIFSCFHIFRIGILPIKYFFLLVLLLLFINFIVYRLVVSKHWQKRMIGCFFSILLFVLIGIGFFYGKTTMNFLRFAFQSRERIENYQVLVLKSSNFGSLKELKNGKIGVPFANFSEGAKLLQTEIKKKTSLTLQENDNYTLVTSLLEKKLRVIVMEEAQMNLYMEMNEEFKENVNVLESIQIKVKNQMKKRDTDLLKKPFSIYVSGNDDYGAINQVSRSDVNMVITVNPVTHKILLTSIPRDYYVTLSNMNGAKDKLTHASLYGIETSVHTLEDLLQVDIDYYVKINFSSLVNLVDAVEGIDINSLDAFTAHYYDEPLKEWTTYSFVKGMNHLNGKEALAFSRERKSFLLGDRTRVEHQQMVLSALIQKIASPVVLKNYMDILNALNGSFDTNFNYEDILAVLQKQLDTNVSWEVLSNVLEGVDGSEAVYSMPNVSTYVMKPSEESVVAAQSQIKEIIENMS